MQPSGAFHTIGIISRPRRSNLEVVVPPLLHWFAARGIRTLYDTETASALHDSSHGLTREEVAEQSQLLLVLGGDGTLLAAARVAARLGIPILPINMGSLGFLTSFTIEEMYPALEQVLAGRFSCSERVMLDVELHRDAEVIERQAVVNEAVINKGALARMIDLQAYVDELGGRFDGGFDPARSISAADHEMTPPAGEFLVAVLYGEPVGCGALKFHPGAPAEVKRMWVAPPARGLGLGRRLLAELEARAAGHGVRVLRLETNQTLAEAISLYRAAGYREVAAFNDEPYAHHWFEKSL